MATKTTVKIVCKNNSDQILEFLRDAVDHIEWVEEGYAWTSEYTLYLPAGKWDANLTTLFRIIVLKPFEYHGVVDPSIIETIELMSR